MDNIKKYKEFTNVFTPFEINEGLIKTCDPLQTILSFTRMVKIRNVRCVINFDASGRLFIDCENIGIEDIKFILSLIGNFGYFVSEYMVNNVDYKFDEKDFIEINFYNKSKIDIVLYIEAKYDISVENIQRFYYHATLVKYIDKILKYGLVPKSKNKLSSHPDRIFLSNNENNAIAFVRFAKAGMSESPDMTILKIDTNNIKEQYEYNGQKSVFKLYNDPNYKGKGFYTLNNIPKDAVTDLKIIINHTN